MFSIAASRVFIARVSAARGALYSICPLPPAERGKYKEADSLLFPQFWGSGGKIFPRQSHIFGVIHIGSDSRMVGDNRSGTCTAKQAAHGGF